MFAEISGYFVITGAPTKIPTVKPVIMRHPMNKNRGHFAGTVGNNQTVLLYSVVLMIQMDLFYIVYDMKYFKVTFLLKLDSNIDLMNFFISGNMHPSHRQQRPRFPPQSG